MSDGDSTASSGKALPWTDEAKNHLLLRILGQLLRSGQSINWKEINIPGRTPKSLQHQWASIRAAVADLEKAHGITETSAKPTAKKTSAPKGGQKRGGDELATPETTPQKPKRKKGRHLFSTPVASAPKSPAVVDESADELADGDPEDHIKQEAADGPGSFTPINA